MKYCYIEDGTISKTRTVDESDIILIGKLTAHGWIPYTDTAAPEYNSDTQWLSHTDVITEDAVTKTWTVNDYSAEQLATRLVTAQATKMAELYANVKRFISTQPNGWPRYDNDLKLNVMNATMSAIAAGQSKPANCVAVETWIYTVQQAFFTLKAAITAAEDMATLNAIDVSYDMFEAAYGREGTVAADPAVSTDDLFA